MKCLVDVAVGQSQTVHDKICSLGRHIYHDRSIKPDHFARLLAERIPVLQAVRENLFRARKIKEIHDIERLSELSRLFQG